MQGQRVKLRLLGIDTPEKFKSRKLARDARECGVSQGYMKNLGQEATHYAKSLLHKGQKVKVVVYGRGYYGRTLALIYLPDGTCYNERIVADGYACVYKYYGHKSRELPWDEWFRLNQLLEEAKKNRRGLWGKDYRVMECLCR
ncbi:MAG: thermonuclease family protein [Candidatus Aenigmarchaeota archaeon]|nr:thermonuclease family protein [Candidatus Aenigmarchaeota archaeon]